MTRKIILFNGPPLAGKDVITNYLCKEYGWVHLQFKEQLFRLVKTIYCISDETWDFLYQRENKELPTPLLNGLSPRQAMIHVSENIIKPMFNKDYFGMAAARRAAEIWKENDNTVIISDSGFTEEVAPLIEVAGKNNLLIVRIYREGCNFDNDSRSYVSIPDIATVDISNNGTLEDFFLLTEGMVFDWLGGRLK